MRMSRSVLLIRSGEVFSTEKPKRLEQALLSDHHNDEDDDDDDMNQLTIGHVTTCEHWSNILNGLSPHDQPLGFRITSEVRMDVEGKLASDSEPDEDGDMLCLVKIRTLRKSEAGTVQVHQIGRYSERNNEVTLRRDQFIVVKAFDLETLARTKTNPLEELLLHQRLVDNHAPGIVPLLGCLASRRKVFALFPYAPDGDMFTYLSQCAAPLTERQIRGVLRQMTQSLMSCHSNRVCHRDISLENFLRSGSELVLIDFGLSIPMDSSSFLVNNHGQVGKHKYMAPELVSSSPAQVDGRKLDVWSLGVTLFMLMTLTEPFHIACPSDSRYKALVLKKKMCDTMRKWGFDRSSSLMNLLCSMLNPDPALRPTTEEILAHPWMAATT